MGITIYSLIIIIIIFIKITKNKIIIIFITSSFGGDTQQIGGVKKTTDFLDKTTWILSTLILILILFSNITLNSENDNFDKELGIAKDLKKRK